MRRQEAGLTLLECIAALVLTGLLLSMLSVVTRQWLTNWNAGAKRAEDVEIIALAASRIANDLSGILAIPGAESSPSLLFKGSTESVNFVIDGNGPHDEGLFSVSLFAGNHGGLSRASRAAQSPVIKTDSEWDENIPLLSNEYSVNFLYMKENGSWLSLWTEPTLPKKIRITIVKADTPFSKPWSFIIKPNAPWPATCAQATDFKECLAGSEAQPITPPQNIEKNKDQGSRPKNGILP